MGTINKWMITWGVFAFSCVLFVSVSFSYGDSKWITILLALGTLILTLVAMVIIMLQNTEQVNKTTNDQIEAHEKASLKQINAIDESTKIQIAAIQNATQRQIEVLQENIQKLITNNKEESEKQIDNFNEKVYKQIESFVEQSENIVSRLEQVTEVLVQMSDQNKQMLENEKILKDIEEKKWLKRIEDSTNEEWEKQEEKERYRPNVHFRLDDESYLVFWKHLHVYLYNNGGRASNITLNLTFQNYNSRIKFVTKTIDRIERLHQENIDIGWIKSYVGYDKVIVEISVRDIFDREYFGKWLIQRSNKDWVQIGTSERLQLGN